MSMLMAILAAGVIASFDHNVVTPAWLEQNLENPSVVVVEIGTGTTADRPHIPGARFIALESIVVRDGWPPNELPPVDQLRQVFEKAGVGDEGRIVLYSDSPVFAARAWFTLDYLGHGDRAAILDGGFDRWTSEKRPVAAKRLPQLAKTFTPSTDPTRLATLDQVRNAASTGVVLLDARNAYDFQGARRVANVARRGHIPGALCNPWQTNLTPEGSFLTPAALESQYEALIGSRETKVIVYCRTGMDASVPYFILRSLGYDVALHDGSFTEWSRDKTLPVATVSGSR